MLPRLLRLWFGLLVFFLLTSCQGDRPPTQTPLATFLPPKALQPAACRFTIPPEDEVSCYTLEVPADYRQVYGEQIELEVVVVKSRGDDPLTDPVIILPLDTGFDFLQYTPFIIQLFNPLLERSDLVLYNNRDLNDGENSPDLSCPEVNAVAVQLMQQPERSEGDIEQVLEAHRTCRRRLFDQEINLDLYTLDQHASDVIALSLALGKRQVNLLGVGFGSAIGPRVVQNHPEVVRSAVFNNVYPPVTAGDLEVSYFQALQRLFEACRFDQDCNNAYPDLEESFLSIIEILNNNPLVLDVLNPINPGMMKVYLDGEQFIQLVRELIAYSGTLPKVPQLIDNVRQGQGYKLAAEMQDSITFYGYGTQGTMFYNNCLDDWTAVSLHPLSSAEVYPPVRDAIQAETERAARACASWLQKDFSPPEFKPFYSDAPVLVFHGAYDPYISTDLLEAWVKNMKNARTVIHPNTSRDFLPEDGCTLQVAAAFFASPEVDPDAACALDDEIEFILP